MHRSALPWVQALSATVGFALVSSQMAAQDAGPASLSVKAPGKAGEPIRVLLESGRPVEWVVFYYRTAGAEDFQSQMVPRRKGERFALDLDPSALPAGAVEYYVALKGAGGIQYLPAGAPEALPSLTLSPEIASRSARAEGASEVKYRFPVNVDGSFEQVLHNQPSDPMLVRHNANGQIRFGLERESASDRFTLAARLSYQDQPYGDQGRWYLGDLRADYARKNHRVRGGDMVIQESEFTVAGSGHRGMDYTYDDRALYFHAFSVSTEQMSGLQAVLWPHADTRLSGAALGYNWFGGKWLTKLIFVDGRDDPGQGTNVGSLATYQSRKGDTVSFLQEATLLENRLNLQGEYARSRVDRDLSDATPAVTDQAWRVAGAYTEGFFNGRASFKSIGKDFDTLGQSAMVGNRVSFDTGFGFNFTQWSLNATAVSERNNPDELLLISKAVNQTQSLDARWSVTQGYTLRAGLTHGRQTAGSQANPLLPFNDSERYGATLGMDWTINPCATLTTTYQGDRIKSTTDTATTGHSNTWTLGGNLAFGQVARLGPSLSWSKVSTDLGNQSTKVFSAFLNADFTLVQRTLGLVLSGAYNRTTAPTGEENTTSSADATLQFFLDRYLRKGRCVFGLRGRYMHTDTAYQGVQNGNQVAFTLNFSF